MYYNYSIIITHAQETELNVLEWNIQIYECTKKSLNMQYNIMELFVDIKSQVWGVLKKCE